jgi:AraC-like DNA-binding protein
MSAVALPQTCSPAGIRLQPGHALYWGPSLELDLHSGSVACLAVALDGPMTVRTHGQADVVTRTALVPPRLNHQVITGSARMVFCYLDPTSSRREGCVQRMLEQSGPIGHHHADEARLIDLATRLPAGDDAWLELAAPGRPARTDPRIQHAASQLLRGDAEDLSADRLAAEAGLSPSRFLHLFRDHTGTSFRRYRLWARMLRAATAIAGGADLTAAALDAGFASPSHFSTAFHRMFGLQPSRLLAVHPDGFRERSPGPA